MLRLVAPPFSQRAEIYLRTVVALCPRLDQDFVPNSDLLIGASYSRDNAEASVILEYLEQKGFIRTDPLLDGEDNYVVPHLGE